MHELLAHYLPPRPLDAHKGMFGHVLVIGGDTGMPGAVRLSAEGALRAGAGLVTVGTRQHHVSSIVCGRPELMCYGLEGSFDSQLLALMAEASVIVLGPGLGQSKWSEQVFEYVIQARCPLVVDAGALTWLAHSNLSSSHWIFTPHPGEAARLLGCSVAEVQADRPHAIALLLERFGGVVVLKGMHTLIMTEGHPVQSCPAGNPGMASPGMGDLLSGLLAGLVAQGIPLWQAAKLGVFIHAAAGDRAAARQGERGLLASDLFHDIMRLVNQHS